MITPKVGTKLGRKSWKALFFVIIDQIWRARNISVFENKKWKEDDEMFLMKMRLALWMKALESRLIYSPTKIIRNINCLKLWRPSTSD